jgi:hypothetical protein
MTALQIQARHVLKVDTRYVVARRFTSDVLASTILFPADPSEFRSDLVWVEDTAYTMRRQPGIAGPDGLFPTVQFRTAGQLQWDIPLRMLRIINSDLENADTDPSLTPRKRNLNVALFKHRLEREISAWSVLKNPAVMTHSITLGPGTRFDDTASASSDPIAVMQQGAEEIHRETGLKVTDVMIPQPIMRKLKQHEKIMSYAVNKLNLSKDREIDGEIIERLIGYDYVTPGAVKVESFTFNNTPDSPYATSQVEQAYCTGPNVIMAARAVPGGVDGDDNGFGLGKYMALLDKAMPDDPTVQIATGNDGMGVLELPNYDVAGGGTTTQVLSLWAPFVQNAKAAYAIYGAANAADTASYNKSLQF